MHKTMHGYIFKATVFKGWDTLAMSGALARWNWGCHNAESHLGRGRASKMRAVFDSSRAAQPETLHRYHTLSLYLSLSLAISGYLSVKIVEELMYKKCDLQVNSPCSSVAELCCIWLKIFCQAWHLFHGAHSHCKAVKLSCCLRPWHTFSSLRKYTRVMLQATHSNSDSLQTPFRRTSRTSPCSKSCSLLGHQPPNSAKSQAKLSYSSRGKLIPVWSCMILTQVLSSSLLQFEQSWSSCRG